MNDDEPKPSAAKHDYEVGYGKPPKQHRFAKGQSGNPIGRTRSESRKTSSLLREEEMKGLIIDEAYRKITVREGEKVVKVSAIQAAIRGLSISAAKGDLRAQREVLRLVRWVEEDRCTHRMNLFKAAIEYKTVCEEELKRRKQHGTTGPELFPHPDDVIVDLSTGEVSFKGPLTKEQKDAQDQLVAMRPGVIKDIRKVQRRLAKEPDNPAHQQNLRILHQTLKKIVIVEGLVRERAPRVTRSRGAVPAQRPSRHKESSNRSE